MTQEPNQESLATRRGMLAGVGLVGLAGALTACGASGASSSPATGMNSTPGGGATMATVPGSSSPAAVSGGAAADALTSTSAIPVGGGKIFDAQVVVVTQPTTGEYKAFSAVCTHMGCIVSKISDGKIECPCHGSEYSVATGDVLRGPAPRPLAAKQIKITGDSIFLE